MKNIQFLKTFLATLILCFSFSNSHAQKSALTVFDSIHHVVKDTVGFKKGVFNTPLPDTISHSVGDSVEAFKYTILNLHTIGTGYRDAGRCSTSPLRWKGKDWLKVAVLGGAGVLIHQLDAPFNDAAYRNDSRFLKGFSNTMDPFGSIFVVLPAIGGTYIYSRLSKNEELSGLSITAGKAVLISNTFVTYAKVLAHRHRPSEDTPSNPNHWDGPRLDFKNASFFSSHTATAFSLATVIASTYADHKWVPPVAYTMASLVGISRITGHDHYATDVFVGAVVGYSVGKLVYRLNRSKKIKLVVGL